jgi:hypothetical protein
MPKPTIHPHSFISLEDAVNRSTVNKSFIELRASDVIECTHVTSVGRFIVDIEMLVNETKLF